MKIAQGSTSYHSDQPIQLPDEDKFQRYNFARRIAQTIHQRHSSEGLVIGIYGSWGEGKTSVLNFIEKELSTATDHIIVKFNPWRFSDEQTLLLQFFHSLVRAIDGKLKSKAATIGGHMKKYAQAMNVTLPVVGNLSKGVEGIGNLMDKADLERDKDKVNQAILQSGKRITVIVDDIDRLEKNEIQSVFRLVKLSADFVNTTYILSFDEKMVAAAIGERFGGGGERAGRSFLEKIIQVPLRLPIIRPELIQAFCLEQINAHLSLNGVHLEEYDRKRFSEIFSFSLLPRLHTPRIATRYSNTLSFSIPLMRGEVNMTELMLVEALKIFYPETYNTIRINPECFLDMHWAKEGEPSNLEIIEEKLSAIEQSPLEARQARRIVDELFPAARTSETHAAYPDSYYNWQCITSPEYFERYFTYAVIRGDLSDLSVKTFVQRIKNDKLTREGLETFLSVNPASVLLKKMRVVTLTLPDERKVALCIALSLNISLFSSEKEEHWPHSAYDGCVDLVSQLLLELPEEETEKAASGTFAASAGLDFVMDFCWHCIRDIPKSFLRDQEDQKNVFRRLMISKGLHLAGGQSIFEAFPQYAKAFFETWIKLDHREYYAYIEKMFDTNPAAYRIVFRAFLRNNGERGPEYFSETLFDCLQHFADHTLMTPQLEAAYSAEELSAKQDWESEDGDVEARNLLYAQRYMELYHTKAMRG